MEKEDDSYAILHSRRSVSGPHWAARRPAGRGQTGPRGSDAGRGQSQRGRSAYCRSLMMEGVAFDPLATEGNGVDRVSVFLDDRDMGGQFLGDAKLGAPNFAPSETAQFANAGWVLTTPALAGRGDSHELFIYARS